MEVNQHRTWAEIDLGAIEHNYRVICEQAKAPVLCVVKADAYGHGAVQVAKRLEKMDAPYFAVATIPEGVDVHRGVEVTVFGPEGWTAEDAADAAGTISYEVLCAISRRVPRFYR